MPERYFTKVEQLILQGSSAIDDTFLSELELRGGGSTSFQRSAGHCGLFLGVEGTIAARVSTFENVTNRWQN